MLSRMWWMYLVKHCKTFSNPKLRWMWTALKRDHKRYHAQHPTCLQAEERDQFRSIQHVCKPKEHYHPPTPTPPTAWKWGNPPPSIQQIARMYQDTDGPLVETLSQVFSCSYDVLLSRIKTHPSKVKRHRRKLGLIFSPVFHQRLSCCTTCLRFFHVFPARVPWYVTYFFSVKPSFLILFNMFSFVLACSWVISHISFIPLTFLHFSVILLYFAQLFIFLNVFMSCFCDFSGWFHQPRAFDTISTMSLYIFNSCLRSCQSLYTQYSNMRATYSQSKGNDRKI